MWLKPISSTFSHSGMVNITVKSKSILWRAFKYVIHKMFISPFLNQRDDDFNIHEIVYTIQRLVHSFEYSETSIRWVKIVP